jgi:hypothetical protein
MYLRSLNVQNLKLVRSLPLSFTKKDGSPRMWTVLVGENGLCKTALLQAIALAAAGHERGNQLVAARTFPDRRRPSSTVSIEATFEFSKARHARRKYPGIPDGSLLNPPLLRSMVIIEPRASILTATSRYIDASGGDVPSTDLNPLSAARSKLELKDGKEIPLSDWFVAAYGVGRALWPSKNGAIGSDFDAGHERFKSLFDMEYKIPGICFADVLEDPGEYAKTLQSVLVKEGHVLPDRITKIELAGGGGVTESNDLLAGPRFEWSAGSSKLKVPAVGLSQGYQGTIAWIADLLGHAFWEAQTPFKYQELEGLVLIDELDLYLHPRWQVELVPKLKQAFPRVQFVVTTHSPMLLPGFEKDEIVRLCLNEEGDVVREEVDRSPALMSGSEIYAQFFGIDDLYPTVLARKLRRYGYLAANPYRTNEEDAEVKGLREALRLADVAVGFEPETRQVLA